MIIHQRIRKLLLGISILLYGGLVITHGCSRTPSTNRPLPVQKPGGPESHKLLQPTIEKHLEACKHECLVAADKRIEELREFFRRCRKNCRPFAEQALSFESKLNLLFSGDAHIRKLFGRCFFSPESLMQEINRTLNLYLQDIKDAENRMLVNLSADLERLAASSSPVPFPGEQFARKHEELIQSLSKQIRKEAQESIVREIVNTIASEVIALAFRALAVRLGILGTGAASGWVTFGVGFLVALVIDALWEASHDPAGKLAGELEKAFQDVEKVILYGEGTKYGLLFQLSELQAQRADIREQALKAMLLHQEKKP